MRVAVTGAGGYVGSRVVASLRAAGLEAEPWLRVTADVTNLAAVRAAVRSLAPNVVVHSAAMADPGRCARDPAQAIRTNVIGTGNLATACLEHGCRMVLLSSDYVFDGMAGRPYHEFDPVCPGWDVYGDTKCQAEALVRATLPAHHILRLTWQFGPPEEAGLPAGGGWLGHLALAARQGRTVRVRGGERRTVTCVYDTAEVVRQACLGAMPHGTYHVAAQSELDWAGVTRLMLRRLGARSDLLEVLPVEEHPLDRRLECRLLPLVGIRPPTLEEGLERALAR